MQDEDRGDEVVKLRPCIRSNSPGRRLIAGRRLRGPRKVDVAGNRIGRAFEVDQFDRTDRSAEPEKTLIPFSVR